VTRRKARSAARGSPREPGHNILPAEDLVVPSYKSWLNYLNASVKYYAVLEGTDYFEKKPDHFRASSLLFFLVHEPDSSGTLGAAPQDYSLRDHIDRETARWHRLHSVARDFDRWREVCRHHSQGKTLDESYDAAAASLRHELAGSNHTMKLAYQRIQQLLRERGISAADPKSDNV
jgi:hypothetical protein